MFAVTQNFNRSELQLIQVCFGVVEHLSLIQHTVRHGDSYPQLQQVYPPGPGFGSASVQMKGNGNMIEDDLADWLRQWISYVLAPTSTARLLLVPRGQFDQLNYVAKPHNSAV